MTPSPIDRYLDALSAALRALPGPHRDDIVREVRAHLLDSAAASRALEPASREQEAVDRFGPVHDIARAMAAERMRDAPSPGVRGVATARARAFAVAGGIAGTALRVLISLGYVALLAVGAVAVAKLWWPDAGLWIHDGGGWSLSFGGFERATEVLGPWAPAYVPVACLVGWAALNRLLRACVAWDRRRHAHG